MHRIFVDELTEALQVDAQGRLTSTSETGRARIRQLAGPWRVFDPGGSIAVLLRDGSAETLQMGPRVALAGDLALSPTADLATFVSQARFSGLLVACSGGVDRSLSFLKGRLCWGASTDPSERLGQVCIRHGLLPRHEVDRLADGDDDRRIGQRFVDAGLMNGHALWKAIQLQVSEIFYGLLVRTRGSFAFVDAPGHPTLDSHLSLDVQGLLLEGVRRVDEMKHFRRRVRSSTLVPRRTSAALDAKATPEERALFDAMDGTLDVVALGIATRLGEFEATKALHGLLERGFAGFEDEITRERTPGLRLVDPLALLEGCNDLLVELYGQLAPSGLDGPYRISVESYLLGERRSHPLLEDLSLEGDGRLPPGVILDRLERLTVASARGTLLHAEIEKLLSFALFQARELLDPRVAEALSARARALLES